MTARNDRPSRANELVQPPRWARRAACSGRSALFFGYALERDEQRLEREVQALRLCAECPVRIVCRDHARSNRELGIWGGEDDLTRKRAMREHANDVELSVRGGTDTGTVSS